MLDIVPPDFLLFRFFIVCFVVKTVCKLLPILLFLGVYKISDRVISVDDGLKVGWSWTVFFF